jgi:glutathione S-transferase
MLKIYEFQGFPNPERVRLALAEKRALDLVTFVSVNVPAGEHRDAAFLAKNPSGAVPALELDDGTVIAECTAITEYLDHALPGPRLTGETAKERAIIHMMQRRAEQRLLDAATSYFHHATAGLGPAIERYQNAAWGEHQKAVALDGLRYFNGVLAETPFVAGGALSMADITVFAALRFISVLGLPVSDDYRHLHAWNKAVAARPGFSS